MRRTSVDHLTELAFSGGRLWVPRVDLPPGTAVRLRIRARDVSLALQPLRGSSILNSFPVTVAALAEDGPAQVMVRLQAGEEMLLTRVTRRSQTRPGDRAGQSAVCPGEECGAAGVKREKGRGPGHEERHELA